MRVVYHKVHKIESLLSKNIKSKTIKLNNCKIE